MKRICSLFLALVAVMFAAVPSFAVSDIDTLFAAADVTSLKTNVIAMLTAFVVIAVIFTGYRFVKRSVKG